MGNMELTKVLSIIAEIVDQCCLHVRSKGDFTIDVQGDLDLAIIADPDKITQVFTILIDNAVKYTRESRIVTINIGSSRDQAEISVKDHGIGIPKEKQANLFQRYYKANTVETASSGLGLGLYICAEIIKKHHGHIGVDSELGEGSTFWFTIPL
jgi:signal transduction histidine kinase